eukprot:scaffold7986_cov18-Tisochrysis_lutea.AAC.2
MHNAAVAVATMDGVKNWNLTLLNKQPFASSSSMCACQDRHVESAYLGSWVCGYARAECDKTSAKDKKSAPECSWFVIACGVRNQCSKIEIKPG